MTKTVLMAQVNGKQQGAEQCDTENEGNKEPQIFRMLALQRSSPVWRHTVFFIVWLAAGVYSGRDQHHAIYLWQPRKVRVPACRCWPHVSLARTFQLHRGQSQEILTNIIICLICIHQDHAASLSLDKDHQTHVTNYCTHVDFSILLQIW